MDLSPDEEHFQGRLLHQAALWDNVELVQELIACGADVDARDGSQRGALHAAALAERSRCLAALAAAGADLDAVSDSLTGGKTALHLAAERGHVENVRTLVAAGAALHLLDAAGDSALALAERAGHRHAASALRDARDALERERLAQHAALRELVMRSDVAQLRSKLAALGSSAGLLVNLAPAGASTLLYLASEAGAPAPVSLLLAAGADGRAHPATQYGPLYVAAYHGHLAVARLLLQHFPQAAQQETVERWLPLHAACLGGHAALVSLLLDHPYPDCVLNTYTDASGEWQYRGAFDVNARDASAQTALHIACTLGSLPCVSALLDYSTPCTRTGDTQCEEPPAPPAAAGPAVLSPLRSGISLGIHAIVSKLTGTSSRGSQETSSVRKLRPVRLDVLRHGESCTACAVRGDHVLVLRRLLDAGAEPSAPAAPPPPPPSAASHQASADSRRRSRSACSGRRAPAPAPAHTAKRLCVSPSPCRTYYDNESGADDDGGGGWTALATACRLRHVQCASLLVAAGAADPAGRALRECLRHDLQDLVTAILAAKAHADPDYKLNKSSVSESVFNKWQSDSSLTYSALCPSTPVIITWRELRCNIPCLRMSWVRAAALHVNARLSSAAAAAALLAVTRIDVSNNELRLLPKEIFQLACLRYLNAAQNKLERLPVAEDPPADEGAAGWRARRPPSPVYTAPALQELYLQDNRLEEVPAALFSLAALTTLDVSNNKLRALPAAVWAAPALRDLNAAFNHLRELPTGHETESEAESAPPGPPPAPLHSSTSQSSRSPSLEGAGGVIEGVAGGGGEDEDAPPVLADRAGNAVWSAAVRAHVWRGAVETGAGAPAPAGGAPGGGAALHALNLAHNQFTCVPAALACRAPSLARLNMSYNSLRSMSYVTSYPAGLRQLDLSHNEITCWPSLPQLENYGAGSPLACYCPGGVVGGGGRPRSGGGRRSLLLSAACPARRHLRLEGIRTLILSNNLLTRIQLTTDDDGQLAPASPAHPAAAPAAPAPPPHNDDEEEWGCGGALKTRLLFPLLSMLDVSCNMLRAVPPALHLLTNLAVLNISGNKDITELPPQMGLLTRLWSLNAGGCMLAEPLRSMLAAGKYKSADIVGYLKSVLHSAVKYSRMRLMLVGQQGIGKTSLLECLRQESAMHHRRKPTQHWAKRMGNKSSRRNISTVGVDIGTWVYERARSTRGPITFRTWDFGGQQEYYATHQYFLSRRSLYLVVWKVTDGRRGLQAALDWLRSIQARAPGSPVIMVGTHYDQVANCNMGESERPEALQRLIRTRVMGAPDADKLGLPRVLDSVEVSCSTRHNMKLLADVIYSVAFSVKPPGSKEPLLEQRIPASYVALEECVTSLARDLPEPVVTHADFKRLVAQYMHQKNLKMFRDAAELHHATMFLHDNGVLLHYDDAALKEVYFLRPQWLCDVLAHVVTVREINPFASQGVMKVEDLAHVLKASPALAGAEEGASSLAVSLLHKFELALCWDARTLLIPPLLPAEEPPAPQLAIRERVWAGGGAVGRPAFTAPAPAPNVRRNTDSPALIQEGGVCGVEGVCVSGRAGSPLTRLLLLTYVPCGFWARLVSRLLSDAALARATAQLYRTPEMEGDVALSRALDLEWGWRVWRRGARLSCACAEAGGELTLVRVREVPPAHDPLLPADMDADTEPAAGDRPHPYENVMLRVQQDGAWCELHVQTSPCIEVTLPAQSCVLRRRDGGPIAGYQSMSLEPSPSVLARVLAVVSDHVDLLLEDWYPSLGTRFVHTSEGRCLITRVVPCPACLRDLPPAPPPDLQHAFRRLELGAAEPRARLSQESRASDGDSGVGADSNASSRLGSVEGAAAAAGGGAGGYARVWAWTVEQCIHCACAQLPLHCPHHAAVTLQHVAPDTLLLDVSEEMRARWEHVTWRGVAGRGAFGTVLAGVWRAPRRPPEEVAVKALQPVPPPPTADKHAIHAYKAAVSRWEREPAAAACRAYCGLRQELTILSQLRHPHTVPLLAVCAAPLALLLPLAAQGGLDGVIRTYRAGGARLGLRAARAALLQVARALEYIHDRRIVYRDLKSENVLVWRMPRVHEAAAAERAAPPPDVHVKLGDYGISRMAPLAGTKGFGGTEGFMAPEIMRYNGEEEYNEKVDCFSFGMLMYEVVSGRQPFEGHEAVKEAVLEGARPALSPRELESPVCVLETMRRCWGGAPASRPSAGALVSLLAAPEYLALSDVASARRADVAAAGPVLLPELVLSAGEARGGGEAGWEVWYGGGEAGRAHSLLVPAPRSRFTHHHTVRLPPESETEELAPSVTALCRVGAMLWLGDSAGRVAVYHASTCAAAWGARVQAGVGGARCAVVALQPLPARMHKVALALASGRLFLVSSSQPEDDTSFVLTELGAAAELRCLAAAIDNTHEVWLWAGGAGLSAYRVSSGGVSSADELATTQITLLAADAAEGRGATHAEPAVFACGDPGVCVCQWRGRGDEARVTARLDCSKLAPCSESLQALDDDEPRTPDNCKVTALCCVGGLVVIGTAWGCVVLAAADSLRPLSVCRPYEAGVRAAVALAGREGREGRAGPAGEGEHVVATFGAGYRPLLPRYAPHAQSGLNPSQYNGEYCLLWSPRHLLPD